MRCFVWFNPRWADAFPSRLMERYQKHTSGKKKNVLPLESSKREEEGLEVGAAVTFKSFYFSYAWLREGSCVCTHARYTAWRSEDNENYSFPSTVWAQQILTPGGKRFLQFSCHASLRSPLN